MPPNAPFLCIASCLCNLCGYYLNYTSGRNTTKKPGLQRPGFFVAIKPVSGLCINTTYTVAVLSFGASPGRLVMFSPAAKRSRSSFLP
jgi:hypothetical protein